LSSVVASSNVVDACYSAAVVKDPKSGDTISGLSSGGNVGEKAHIINKAGLDEKALQGPGSLDPKTLGPPAVADARRWLAKKGVELLLPEGWRFMGLLRDGKSISFNHSGTADGHAVDISTWSLAEDTPLQKFLEPYVEEVEDMVRLGRLQGHERMKLGDADGILLVGWGPDSKPAYKELAATEKGVEEIYLATDGTGRRAMSWRGAVKKANEVQLVIISFSSPIDTFMDARAAYDAMVRGARLLA
jgi:hypothetical protein